MLQYLFSCRSTSETWRDSTINSEIGSACAKKTNTVTRYTLNIYV